MQYSSFQLPFEAFDKSSVNMSVFNDNTQAAVADTEVKLSMQHRLLEIQKEMKQQDDKAKSVLTMAGIMLADKTAKDKSKLTSKIETPALPIA